MLQAALDAKHGVKVVWQFHLLPWSRGMLELIHTAPWHRNLSSTSLIYVNNSSSLLSRCTLFSPRLPGDYTQMAWAISSVAVIATSRGQASQRAASRLRSAVLQSCGIAQRRKAAYPPRNALYMPRQGADLQSGTARNFVAWKDLVHSMQVGLPSISRLRVVGTPGPDMRICDQVRLWAASDVILTPNGAHFVNALFLTPGSILFEGVPWSMRNYPGQPTITRWSDVHHLRLHSARPPATQQLGRYAQVSSEAQCMTDELCMRAFRDKANISINASSFFRLVRRISMILGCTNAPNWHNGHGSLCADYATPQTSSPRGVASYHGLRAGGWCSAGEIKREGRWCSGVSFRWPERACCACGGGVRLAPRAS